MDIADETSEDVPEPDRADSFAPLRRENLGRGARWAVGLVVLVVVVVGAAELVASPDPDLAAACERAQELPDAGELTRAEHGPLLSELARQVDDGRIDDAVDFVFTGVAELAAGPDSAMTEGQARSLVERGMAELDRVCAESR